MREYYYYYKINLYLSVCVCVYVCLLFLLKLYNSIKYLFKISIITTTIFVIFYIIILKHFFIWKNSYNIWFFWVKILFLLFSFNSSCKWLLLWWWWWWWFVYYILANLTVLFYTKMIINILYLSNKKRVKFQNWKSKSSLEFCSYDRTENIIKAFLNSFILLFFVFFFIFIMPFLK